MKLSGKYRILIEGDISELPGKGGRNRDLIGYLMQRLLTGDTAAVSELGYWGITVTECAPDDDEFVRIERMD